MARNTPVTSATNTKKTIANSSTAVLTANPDRAFVILVNDSDEAIYVTLGSTAVINSGIRLNATGGTLKLDNNSRYTGPIAAICASGSKNLTVCHG